MKNSKKIKPFFFMNSGSMTIEISIMFPIFCIVAMSFVFYMHGMALQMGMEAAAREGAREIVRSGDVYSAQAIAQKVLDDFNIDKTTITVRDTTDLYGIIIDRPYEIYIPFVGNEQYKMRRVFFFYPDVLGD